MPKGIFFLVLMVALFIEVSLLHAQWKLNGSMDVDSFSRYVSGTSGQTLFDHNVIQGSVTVQAEKPGDYGIYGTVWMSYIPQGGFDDDFGDEIDYVAGFWKIFRGITFDLR